MNAFAITLTERKRRRDCRSGIVLVIVLVVIVLISLAAYGFVTTMQIEYKAAHIAADQAQVDLVAASGQEFLARWLESPARERAEATLSIDEWSVQQVLGPEGDESAPVGWFRIISPMADETGAVENGVQDESSKLHLATVLEWERQSAGAGRAALMRLPGMTTQIADAILDWMDQDDTPREFGAEAGDYARAALSYVPRNAVPGNLEELLMVQGVTWQQLFGSDNRRTLSHDPPTARVGFGSATRTSQMAPWAKYLTTYSAERNEAYDGEPRIYLNEDNLLQLHRQLQLVFPAEWSDFIIALRQFGPAEEDAANASSTKLAIDLSKPATHALSSPLDLVDVSVNVPSGSDTKQFQSPFRTNSGVPNALDRFLDRVTVNAEPVLVGRINVRTAPREVLLAIPELEEDQVARVLATRSVRSSEYADSSLAWLLTQGIVDLQRFKRILPYITTGGDVVRCQIVAGHALSRLQQQCEVVWDATGAHARRVYVRDLQPLGRLVSTDLYPPAKREGRTR